MLRDPSAARWLVFTEPADVLLAENPRDVVDVVDDACRRAANENVHIAGFLGYEAAPAFDPAFTTQRSGDFPLACFGVFSAPKTLSRLPPPAKTGRRQPLKWQVDVDRERYRRNIEEIRRQIACGNTYQVNYTVRQHAKGPIDAWRLFYDIARDAPYAGFIEMRDHAVVSASPELFFELSGNRLTCRPMKGTAARGVTTREDDRIRAALAASVKDRAENVMIADMVRNDMGRIALPGSVHASSLFDIEKYRTVWQMTSTITAETDVPVPQIFGALFPSASITGAPKVASMQRIAEIEDSPRQVYTGCIGFVAPGRRARFNVAIRTVVVDRRDETAVYGVGGGIVWDSDADAEYQECLSKAGVLGAEGDSDDFSLLETLLWTPDDGFSLLGEHLERLEDSARYFDFACDPARAAAELDAFAAGLPGLAQRVRLRLHADGSMSLDTREAPVPAPELPVRVRVARQPVDPANPWLYHKTTRRGLYESALAAAGECDDVLLWNCRGELTESTIANIVVRSQGELCTPPVSSGLLAGTLRRNLLAQGTLTERIVRVDELPSIDELYLVNSVRGWRRAYVDDGCEETR